MPIILQKWNTLINITLNPLSASSMSITDETIKSFIAQSESERENVKNLLIEGVIDRQKIMDKQQFVQVIQAMLIRLLNKLHTYKQVKQLDNKLQHLFNTISEHLEEVLNFIEDFFSSYFDRNEKVPAPYLLISISELCRQLQKLQERIEVNEAIDRELTVILINNFNPFCSIKSSGPTYNELSYQKDLMNDLLTGNVLTSQGSIREVLFYFNFNDDDFIAYLFGKLKALTESSLNNKEKIAVLRYEQKNINQFITKPNCYLSPSMPSLKEQVNNWIEEETKFLQTEPSFSLLMKTEGEDDNKIETSLSVTKLALWLSLWL